MRKPATDGPKYLTEQEIELLFEAIDKAKSIRDRAMFRVAYHRGLRVSEIGNLNLADYHEIPGRPPTARLMVRRLKGSRHTEYELTDVEHQAVNAWLRIRGRQPGPLFPSRNHMAISRRRVHQLMRQYCGDAGIPIEKAHPHTLKHSCATHVLAMTNDPVATQYQLGHADLRSTMGYAQFTKQEETAQKLKGWGKKRKK